jgi:hypothetical protein
MSDLYYILKRGAFYRPDAHGYTQNVWEAGSFTHDDAVSYSHPNGPDGPTDGITMVSCGLITIGLGGWLDKVEVHQPGHQKDCPEKLKNWYIVTDANEVIAYFRGMDDAFTFKLDYINGKINA